MKSLFGTANKGIGKLKGFIWGNTSNEESQETQSSEENQSKENITSSTNTSAKTTNNQKMSPAGKPKEEEPKSNTIIKSSKGQFDFSEEDDDEEASKPKKNQNESETGEVNFEYSEPEEDYWKIAHRLYLKNSMVDIEPLPYVPFIKIKKNDNLLSLMGFGNKKPFTQQKKNNNTNEKKFSIISSNILIGLKKKKKKMKILKMMNI